MDKKIQYKLSNTLLENNERTRCYTGLFYQSAAPVLFENDNSVLMSRGMEYDFSTFFGSFSYKKWILYTDIDNAHLCVNINGRGSIVIYGFKYQNEFHVAMRRLLREINFDNTEYDSAGNPMSHEGGSIDVDITEFSDYDVIGFAVNCRENCLYNDAYWYTNINENKIRDVELSLCITTFKKEDYILKNIEQFNTLMSSDEPIADHLQIHIVDNGRTLDVNCGNNPRIRIHPNKNVGGAGGFARGMIESLRASSNGLVEPTHILVMDDDISVLPEAFIRTYNLLRIVNNKYREAFVSGAMMAMQTPNEQFEDIGHITKNGWYETIKRHYNMFEINDVCENESILPTNQHQYAAFWFCCFPIEEIQRNGLPLPLFIRGDDAEFGLRDPERRFITMNGICVWHDAFGQSKFRANLECYMSVRNSLIIQTVSPSYEGSDTTFFYTLAKEHIEREFRKFAYNNVELVLQAIEDYLAGPEYLMNMDAEAKMKSTAAMNTPSVDLGDFVGVDMDDLWEDKPRSFFSRAVMYVTRNCQRLFPNALLHKDSIGVPNDFLWSPLNRVFKRTRIVMLNEDRKTGVIRRRDDERFKELFARWKRAKKAFKVRKAEVAEKWREAYPKMMSIEFWEKYLGI